MDETANAKNNLTIDNGDGTVTVRVTFFVDQTPQPRTSGHDEIPSEPEVTSDVVENVSAVANDESPRMDDVKTPFFKCMAADPCRCRFHGAAALSSRLSEMLKGAGIESVKSSNVTSVGGGGKKGRYQVDLVVGKGDAERAREVLDMFLGADGLSRGEEKDSMRGRSATYKRMVDVDFLKDDAESDDDCHAESDAGETASVPTDEGDDEEDGDAGKWKTMEEFFLEASKMVTSAAKTINRSVDRGGARPPNMEKVSKATGMEDGIRAAMYEPTLTDENFTQAVALLKAIDEIKKSGESGYKTKIGVVPTYSPTHTSPISYGGDSSASTPTAEERDEIRKDEGVTADYLRAVAAEFDPDSAMRMAALKLARRDEKILREDAEKPISSDPGKDEGEASDSHKTESEGGSTLTGFKWIHDGDTGADINARREASGLPRYRALDAVDKYAKEKDENFREATRDLAKKYGDPELDISDPTVFAEVEKNWAETVKRIATEGRFVSFAEPHNILGFLTSGKYMTAFDSEDYARVENLAALYDLKTSDKDEATLSAMIVPNDAEKMFKTACCDRFGPVCVEWSKESDLIPCFSNCDAAEPAEQDRSSYGKKRVYNPTLISNPKLCSLAAMCNGLSSIMDAVGRKTPDGRPMMSFAYAIKLLRKGPIASDAGEFDRVVNGEDKAPVGGIQFGWNETPMIGRGTTQKCAAIHINSEKWNRMARGRYPHGSDTMTADQFVEKIKAHSATLKANGIKIILDGKEVPV